MLLNPSRKADQFITCSSCSPCTARTRAAPGHATFSSASNPRRSSCPPHSRHARTHPECDVFAWYLPRQSSAVKHQSGQVHARQRHGRRRIVLSQPTCKPRRQKAARATSSMDRQSLRGLPVTPSCLRCPWSRHRKWRCIELHGRAARRANAFFHLRREAAQMKLHGMVSIQVLRQQ